MNEEGLMSQQLPPGINLTFLKKQAKKLRTAVASGDSAALKRVRAVPEVAAAASTRRLSVARALLIIAREQGFSSWPSLKQAFEISANTVVDPVSAFLLAACQGRPSEVGSLLSRHMDLIRADPWAASAAGEGEAVTGHLSRDASLARKPGGPIARTPLQYLCSSNLLRDPARVPGFLRAARALLAAGADANARMTDTPKDHPNTQLYGTLACPELMRILLDAGADPNDNQTLYSATEQADFTCMAMLLEHPRLDRAWASYCLLHMLDFDSVEGVRLFLRAGVDVNGPFDSNKETALVKAVRRPGASVEIVRLLLAHGADPSQRNEVGASPYALARRAGNREIAELLHRDGDEESLPPSEEFIAACGDADAARAARIAREHPGLTESLTPLQLRALLQFAMSKRNDSVRIMLDAGVPVGASDDKNQTALHGAAFSANLELIDELIARGAPLDVHDTNYHATPLDHAVAGSLYANDPKADHVAALEKLIAAGSPLPERAWGSEAVLAVLRRNGIP
jgi:ankyrin repeat protein